MLSYKVYDIQWTDMNRNNLFRFYLFNLISNLGDGRSHKGLILQNVRVDGGPKRFFGIFLLSCTRDVDILSYM